MTTKHPSEAEMQQFALGIVNCTTPLIDHIQSCESCRVKADTYKLIFSEIKVQPKPVFDFNLTDLVMSQLPQPKPKTSFENIVLYTTVVVSILIAGFAIYFFKSFLSNAYTGITPIVSYLVITTLASLLIFLGIDMVAKYNRQMKILNFN